MNTKQKWITGVALVVFLTFGRLADFQHLIGWPVTVSYSQTKELALDWFIIFVVWVGLMAILKTGPPPSN